MGRIFKDELKELKEKNKIKSPTELEYAICVAKDSVKYFKTANEIIESYQNSPYIGTGDVYDEASVYMVHSSSYFGQIDTNLMLSEILLDLTENLEQRKSLVRYLQNKSLEEVVEDIFSDKINNWREYETFLIGLD